MRDGFREVQQPQIHHQHPIVMTASVPSAPFVIGSEGTSSTDAILTALDTVGVDLTCNSPKAVKKEARRQIKDLKDQWRGLDKRTKYHLKRELKQHIKQQVKESKHKHQPAAVPASMSASAWEGGPTGGSSWLRPGPNSSRSGSRAADGESTAQESGVVSRGEHEGFGLQEELD